MSRYSGLTKIAYAKSAAVEKTAQYVPPSYYKQFDDPGFSNLMQRGRANVPVDRLGRVVPSLRAAPPASDYNFTPTDSPPIDAQRRLLSNENLSRQDIDRLNDWNNRNSGAGLWIDPETQQAYSVAERMDPGRYDKYSRFTRNVKKMDDWVNEGGGLLPWVAPWVVPGYMSSVSAANAEIADRQERTRAAQGHAALATLGVLGPLGQGVKALSTGPAAFARTPAARGTAGWLARNARSAGNFVLRKSPRLKARAVRAWKALPSARDLWTRPVGNALKAVGHAGGTDGNVNSFTRVANRVAKPFEWVGRSKLYSKLPSYETMWYGTDYVEDVYKDMFPQYPAGVHPDLASYVDSIASQNYAAADPGANRVARGQSELLQRQPSRVDMTPANLPPSPAVVQNQPSAPVAEPNPRNASLFQRQPSRAEMMPPGL